MLGTAVETSYKKQYFLKFIIDMEFSPKKMKYDLSKVLLKKM